MVFTQKMMIVPGLMQILAAKSITVLYNDQVEDYKELVVNEDLKSRQNLFWKQHPLLKLLIFSKWFWTIGAATTVALVIFGHEFIAAMLIVFSLAVMTCLAMRVARIKRCPWKRSPFNDFREEYDKTGKTAAYYICRCYKRQANCKEPCITLEVEWHQADPNKVKFLVASNEVDPDEPEYYVDYWETKTA